MIFSYSKFYSISLFRIFFARLKPKALMTVATLLTVECIISSGIITGFDRYSFFQIFGNENRLILRSVLLPTPGLGTCTSTWREWGFICFHGNVSVSWLIQIIYFNLGIQFLPKNGSGFIANNSAYLSL